MAQLFTNNATSTLASGINNSTTSISLEAGTGSRFPNPSGSDYFYLTIFQRSGGTEINHEVVKVTARSTDTLTVTRAQEGTTAKSFNTSDPVELRLTTGFLKDASVTNVTFSGTGRRIVGDFDNGTLGNRTLFQVAGTNANTSVGAIPIGSNTQSDFTVFNSSDPANSSYFGHTITSTKALLTSAAVGTGSALPVAISIGGTDRVTVDTSGNVGIGTSSPSYKLVVNNASTYSSVSGQTSSSTVAHLTSEAACNFWLDSYTTGSSGIIGRKANGSSTTPSATLADNALLAITARGYGATGWGGVGVASISIIAAENFTDTAQGAYIKIETAPTGSTTRAERMRIAANGNVEFKNGIVENVYTITDGAAFEINPTNGTVQLITLGANRTPKATSFAAGQSVTLMVLDGTAYTLTWTDATFGTGGVVWVGGTAPTLDTTKYTVIELWKVGSQVYGALVGAA